MRCLVSNPSLAYVGDDLPGCLYADKYIKKVVHGGGGDITEQLYTYNSYLYFRTGFESTVLYVKNPLIILFRW